MALWRPDAQQQRAPLPTGSLSASCLPSWLCVDEHNRQEACHGRDSGGGRRLLLMGCGVNRVFRFCLAKPSVAQLNRLGCHPGAPDKPMAPMALHQQQQPLSKRPWHGWTATAAATTARGSERGSAADPTQTNSIRAAPSWGMPWRMTLRRRRGRCAALAAQPARSTQGPFRQPTRGGSD